jgi:hypothetical protein
VGDGVSVGPYCVIADHEQAGAGGETPQPIAIGDDVWLGSRVTVLPGAQIGRGSVIAAGSVVVGRIALGVVAGGNPARPLRSLTPAPGDARPSSFEAPPVVAAAPARPAPTAEAPKGERLRGVVLADFTLGELETLLRSPDEGPVLGVAAAPYCQVVPTLLAGPPEGARDFAVVWTRPERVSPAFQRLIDFEPASQEELERDVDTFVSQVLAGAQPYRLALVPTWTMPAWYRGLGMMSGKPGRGTSWGLAVMNSRLMAGLAPAGRARRGGRGVCRLPAGAQGAHPPRGGAGHREQERGGGGPGGHPPAPGDGAAAR